MPNRPAQLAGKHSIVVRRLLPARREDVYALWVDAERMPHWILDGGSATLDVRVGGKYHLDMHYEGKSYPHSGEYLELIPPKRLVFTWISESTNWLPSIVTIDLIDRGEQTEIVLTHEGLPDEKSAISHQEGWTEIVGWLERELPALL
jgi:uncharacterized protein YndB with AHSA1/START domain